MKRYFILILATLGLVFWLRGCREEYVITDFSKPYKILFTTDFDNSKIEYGVEGKVEGGIFRVSDNCTGSNMYTEIPECDRPDLMYPLSGTIDFSTRITRVEKGRKIALTIFPDSTLNGKVKVYFKERKMLF